MTYQREKLALPVLEFELDSQNDFFLKKVKDVPFRFQLYFQQTIWKRTSGTVHEPFIQVEDATLRA